MPAFTMTFHSISIVNVDRFYLGRHTLADSLWMTVHESGQREDSEFILQFRLLF